MHGVVGGDHVCVSNVHAQDVGIRPVQAAARPALDRARAACQAICEISPVSNGGFGWPMVAGSMSGFRNEI